MAESAAPSSEARSARLIPCAVLVGASLLAFAPFLLKGVGFLYGDVLRAYRPIHLFAMGGLWDGAPLWCPSAGLGHPVLAAGEMPLFYPPALIAYATLGVDLGMSVLLPFHAALASILAFLLARRMRISTPAAVCAGLSYALSGWVLGHLVHTMFLWSAAWLPGVLLGLHGLLRDERGRGRILLPVSMAAVLLSSAFPIAFVIAVSSGACLVAMVLTGARGGRVRGVGRVAPRALLGVGLAAVTLLPVLLHLDETRRAEALGSEKLLEISYHPAQAATLVSPFALGSSVPGEVADPLRYFGRSNFQELSGYVGGLTLILALFALGSRRRRSTVLLLWGGTGALFLVALGAHSPVGRALAGAPGFSLFRVFPRFLLPATLALSLLGGIGLDRLLSAERRGRRRLATVMLTLGGLAGITALALTFLEGPLVSAARGWITDNVLGRPGRDAPAEHYLAYPEALLRTVRGALWRPAALAILAGFAVRLVSVRRLGWVFVGLLALDLASMHWMGSTPREAPEPPPIAAALRDAGIETVYSVPGVNVSGRAAARLLLPNLNVQAGLASPGVDSQLRLAGRESLRDRMQLDPLADGSRPLGSRGVEFLRDLGVEAVVFNRADGPVVMPDARVIAEAGGIVALAVPDPLPAAWVVERLELPPDPNDRATVAAETPTSQTLTAKAGRGSILVVRGTWAPGWSAIVNGKDAPVFPATGNLRAVRVPAGESTVEMTYRPPGFGWGAGVSLASALILVALGLGARRRRKRDQ